jgi:subtilisin family serine protease
MPADAAYTPDLEVEIEVPQQKAMEMDARDAEEPFLDLQWDKTEQDIETVHEDATGDGARIGIVDDGVLGAGDRKIAGGLDGHPDLPNVRSDLSVNFTDDGEGPGPLNDDHGTHCAGTAAAAANGTGVVGVAPDAEVVDLRVFSGTAATFADVAAAVIVGAAPEGASIDLGFPASSGEQVFEGAGCDVLNLSLGSGPIPEDAPGVGLLVDFISAAGSFAVGSGTLPVASAGNESTNTDEGVVVLPAEAEGFVSVGAAGPVGFGWPLGPGQSETVAGIEIEDPPRPELPTEEPAFFTNYGAEGVDVTAGGGNADTDAVGSGSPWFADLVFNTGIANLLPPDPDGDDEIENPEDILLDEYVPGYTFKAGTSFSAPNVAGLAALLFAAGDDPTPAEVRDTIQETARPLPVGRAGQTTAPGAEVNVSADGTFDGDKPSNPGSAPGPFNSDTYRGEGHIDVKAAVEAILDDAEAEDDEDGEGGNGQGRGD